MPETNEPTQTPNPAAEPGNPPPGGEGQPPAEGAQPPAGGDTTQASPGDVLDTNAQDTAESSTAGDVLEVSDDAQQEGVPDQYTFEVPEDASDDLKKIAEALDETKLNGFMETAKDVGLTQAQFQKLVEYDLERTQAAATEAVDAWNDRVAGWKEAALTDKEFGGESYQANVKTALTVVEQFGDADLKALIKSPSEQNPEGLAISNHPAFLRFLNRIGKKLGDPNLVVGDDVQQEATSEARLKRLYPSMFKESA